jgi:hypothetical protein
MCVGFQFVEDERVGFRHADGTTHLRRTNVSVGSLAGHESNCWTGTCLDGTFGGAIPHNLLPAPLLVLHLDHTAELLVRGTKHGDFNPVRQASIPDRCRRCVSGFLALVEELPSSGWDRRVGF